MVAMMVTEEQHQNSAEVASILLKARAVTLRLDPPYTWTSGMKAPIYTDNRLLMSYPRERARIVESFVGMIKRSGIRCDGIAATAVAGIPWGAWIADRLGLPMVFVRGKAKGHGKENAVEGIVEKGKRYVVVEDLISTGGSSAHTVAEVRAKGGIAEDVVAIFTYQLPVSGKAFKESKVRLSSLCDFSALIATAVEEGYIKKQDEAAVLKWKECPERWQP